MAPRAQKHGKFYASVIGYAPRAIVCLFCIHADERELGSYRGIRKCERCGLTAFVVVQGPAARPDH
jgi:hypothetical protein